jgi:hypothetical protein
MTADSSCYVRIVYPGHFWKNGEVQIEVRLDYKIVGEGSLKKGFDIYVWTDPGQHNLHLKPSDFLGEDFHTIRLPGVGCYEIRIDYGFFYGSTATLVCLS